MRERDYAGLVAVVREAVKPDWADVVARAGRRHRFRRALGAMAVAIAVAAGGGVVVATGSGDPSPAPTPTPSLVPGSMVSLARSQLVVGDLDRYYTVVDACVGKACRPAVAVSEDRGRTWTRRPAPGTGINISIAGAGGRTIVVREVVPKTNDFAWWASTDAGETWHRSREHRRASVPDDWPTYRATVSRIGAFDPRTGDRVAFPVSGTPVRSISLRDGGRWLVTVRDDVVTSLVRPGSDTTRLDLVGAAFRDVATADGRTVYLAKWEKDLRVRLFVSTDGGRSWRQGAAIRDEYPGLRLLVADDGTLFVSGATGVYRSTDRGRTLEPLGADSPRAGSAMARFPGGYAMVTGFMGPDQRIWWSTDGKTWTVAQLQL
ncbi:sialidase family protein [Asanoa sp. WMMD1127]|uniref:WD40/YVTN/BNR-like repeat-containing protein n=1 Tax=Asanoa sp. WMMD1127 TaxID=3016107 RepID=UPI00241616F1|nr:sialidase family protein [Asanoa sp. WMMD1127]MDG4824377.1 sialidase family protein [Asanoa sp. WMMD1127]